MRARVSENKPIADGTLGPHKRVRVQLQLSRILLISVHYEDATTYISTLVFVWTASQEWLCGHDKGHETAPQWALYCTATIVL